MMTWNGTDKNIEKGEWSLRSVESCFSRKQKWLVDDENIMKPIRSIMLQQHVLPFVVIFMQTITIRFSMLVRFNAYSSPFDE